MTLPAFVYKRPVLCLALLLCVLFSAFVGGHSYITPSEARYIEAPRQMVVTGDWVVPQLNGVPYFEKPPLFYWLQAAVFSLFGWGEYAGRMLTALLSAGICMLTYAIGNMLHSRRVGMAAALALASSWLCFALSRMVMLDVPLTFCLTAIFYFFLRIARGEAKPWEIYAMYAMAAAGMMTKGLIALVIPAMVVLPWLALTGRWSLLRHLRIPSGLLLFLALALPWHIAAGARYPEFWHFYFIYEHFDRFTNNDHHRNQPLWFFTAVIVVGMMPWTLFAAAKLAPQVKKIREIRWGNVLQRLRTQEPYTLFLILWAVLPFLFFSLSHSQLVPYIYVIFPALFVLLAPSLVEAWKRRGRFIRILALCAALTFPVGYVAQMEAPHIWRGSMKDLAIALKPRLQPGDEIIMLNNYRHDLSVYLNQNYSVSEYNGELAFGKQIEPKTHEWMISIHEFWRRCKVNNHRIYLLVTDYVYNYSPPQCALHPVDFGVKLPPHYLLLTNWPPA